MDKIEARARARGERGELAPLSFAALFLVIAMGGLFVDFAFAQAMNQMQSNDLAAARETVNSAPVAFAAKNSDNPGRETAEAVARALRDNGYTGSVTVWFYEAPEGDVPESKRAMAWACQTDYEMPSMLMRFAGVEGVSTGSTMTSSSMPYSSGRTWRPADSGNGKYTLGAHEDPTAMAYEATDQYPQELADAVASRIAEAESDA